MNKKDRDVQKESLEINSIEKTTQGNVTRRKRSWASKILIVLCAGVLLLGVVFTAAAYFFVKTVQFDETKLSMIEATAVLDQKGQVAAELFRENRKYIELGDIPQMVLDAFIAVEDKRYFEHRGIDYRAIIRAIYRDILAGGKVEGGSTITQQLVKNVFLSHEKSWKRKLEELVLSIKIERQYSKEQILEMYLNYIYFGHGAHGLAAAAEQYFSKRVEELELHEIALLAALPKAPSHYSPLVAGNEERSEQRRKLVLHLMEEQGKITKEQREEAENKSLVLAKKENIENPALWTFIDMMLVEAAEKYNLSQEELLTGGYQIYTTLEPSAQEAMYEALSVDSPLADTFFPFSGLNEVVQGSMVIMNHQTGAVAAIMGGRDYVRKGFNRAISEQRQAGSTFKPIVTYATALEAGWEPYDFVVDERITYPGGYSPRNYNNQYRGKVTMLEAVQYSYNAPAVWLLNEVGIQQGIDVASKLGFEHLERKLGIALGDAQASPLQLARAYGTFANNGVMSEPYFIEKIVDRQGQVIAEHETQQQQIVSEQTAWYMTSMLREVIEKGTGTKARLTGHELAGKTGTTQGDGQNGVRDAWFAGYTPQYVAVVWMGFDHYGQGNVLNTSGSNHPALIFQFVMDKALADKPLLAFEKPEGVKDPALSWRALWEQKRLEKEEKKRKKEEEKRKKAEEKQKRKEEKKKKKEEEKKRKVQERKKKE